MFQIRLGTNEIIFRRTEDYEPIDPEWLANFEFRPHQQGVWVSSVPRIALYIKPEYQVPGMGVRTFFGIYTIDGVETKVHVEFSNPSNFRIYDPTKSMADEGIEIDMDIHPGTLLEGTYRVDREHYTYRLTPHFEELLGRRDIFFHFVEDYRPIDPEWLESFVFRPELE